MTTILSRPGFLLRLEGAVVLAMALLLYGLQGGSWLLFALLLLAPDLSMLGYLAGKRLGTALYNLFHIYLLPAGLVLYGLLGANPLVLSLSLIWLAHIGMDRMVGYGLKYESGFKDTHFEKL